VWNNRGVLLASISHEGVTVQVPLYKLFLIIAIYGVTLAALSSYGLVAVLLAILVSTAASVVVILIRKKNLASVCLVGLSSIGGGLAGCLCLPDLLVAAIHGYDHGFGETEQCMVAGAAIGAIVGGIVASTLLKRNRGER